MSDCDWLSVCSKIQAADSRNANVKVKYVKKTVAWSFLSEVFVES